MKRSRYINICYNYFWYCFGENTKTKTNKKRRGYKECKWKVMTILPAWPWLVENQLCRRGVVGVYFVHMRKPRIGTIYFNQHEYSLYSNILWTISYNSDIMMFYSRGQQLTKTEWWRKIAIRYVEYYNWLLVIFELVKWQQNMIDSQDHPWVHGK